MTVFVLVWTMSLRYGFAPAQLPTSDPMDHAQCMALRKGHLVQTNARFTHLLPRCLQPWIEL